MDSSKLRDVILCALVPVAAVFATLPFVEMGIIDDYSYTHIALHLADTGKMVCNGQNSPIVGFQAYWAALFIKLFGFSFTLVRLSTLPFVAGCSVLLYLIAVYAGLSRSRAIFLAFFVTCSPLALPVEASFMTDVPALFFLLFCLFSVLKATDPEATSKNIAAWSAILTLAGLIGGTIRQYNFLVPAALLLYIAWRSRSLLSKLWCGVCGLTSVTGGLAIIHWFSLQPYAVVMPLIPPLPLSRLPGTANNLLGLLVEYAVLVVPVGVLYSFARVRLPRAGWLALFGLSLLFGAVLILGFPSRHHRLFHGMTGDIITDTGILQSGTEVIGDKPRILPIPLQIVLAGIGTGLLALVGLELIRRPHDSQAFGLPTVAKWLRSDLARARAEHVCVLFGCIYCPLILSRALVPEAFDRYLLPLLATGGLCLLLWLPSAPPVKLTAGWVFAALFAFYGVATTHDYLACSRARLRAADMLQAAHIPRRCISAGFEYDGWTEVALRGHINSPEIALPRDSYKSQAGRKYPLSPPYWVWDMTPTLQPSYLVVISPQPGLLTLKEFTVGYRAWIPPFKRHVLVQTAVDFVAGCWPNTRALPAGSHM